MLRGVLALWLLERRLNLSKRNNSSSSHRFFPRWGEVTNYRAISCPITGLKGLSLSVRKIAMLLQHTVGFLSASLLAGWLYEPIDFFLLFFTSRHNMIYLWAGCSCLSAPLTGNSELAEANFSSNLTLSLISCFRKRLFRFQANFKIKIKFASFFRKLCAKV